MTEAEGLVVGSGEAGRYLDEVDEVVPQFYQLAPYQVALVQQGLHSLLPPLSPPRLSLPLFLEDAQLTGVDQHL